MPHPTLTLLSEFIEDVVPAPERAAVEQHLERCADCRAAVDELYGVRSTLGRTPVPSMPESVAARLEDALAEEAATRVHETRVQSITSISRARHRQSRRSNTFRRALTAVAAVAVLGIGGAAVFQVVGTPGGERQAGPSESASRKTPPSDYTLASSGIALTSKDFASEVGKAVEPVRPAKKPSKAPKPSTKKPSGDISGMTNPPKRTSPQQDVNLDLCVDRALPRNVFSTMLDSSSATFDGRSATLVITRGSKAGSIRAYVVVGCPDNGRIVHKEEIVVSR